MFIIFQLVSCVSIVDCAQFNYPSIKSHKKSVGVMFHAGGGSTNSKLPGNDGAAALEHWNLMTKTQQTITLREMVTKSAGKFEKKKKTAHMKSNRSARKLKTHFNTALNGPYRTHGDGDVKVLGSVVLVEGVDVKPELQNANKQTHVKTTTPERAKNPENVFKLMLYLVFSRQVGSNSPGSLVSNRVHQQVSPCGRGPNKLI